MILNGKQYNEVKERLPMLYKLFPEAYIVTEILWHDNASFDRVCIQASIYPNTSETDKRVFTGIAYEERVPGNTKDVNFSAWVENCETSAIGRAMANRDIGVGNGVERPSAEEMEKVERAKAAKGITTGAVVAKTLPLPDNKFLERVEGLKTEIKALFGHDQHYAQLLFNMGGLYDAKDMPRKSQQDFLDSLAAFITGSRQLIEKYGGKTLKDLDEKTREEVETTAKKFALF